MRSIEIFQGGDPIAGGVAHELLAHLPGANFVPWSFLDERDPKTPADMTACVGFGFIETLGSENEHEARMMHLSNYPGRALVVPRVVLEHEERKAASPLHSYFGHPTCVTFVASTYRETWKIHSMVPLRTSTTGLNPVDSHHED